MRWIGLFAALIVTTSISYAADTPLPPDTPLPRAVSPGANQMKLGTNAAAAQKDVGITFSTPELSHFNDRTCADGPCRNNIPGIAHRSWPLNSCVAVCNLQNKRCAMAIIMDRGPAEWLTRRTIDANPALRQVLGMGNSGLVPATYKLESLPGKGECKTGTVDSGKLQVSGIDPYNVQAYSGQPTGQSQTVGQAYQSNQPTQQGYPQAMPSQQAQPVYQQGGAQPSQYFSPQQTGAPSTISSGLSNLPSMSFSDAQPVSSIADKLLSLLGATSSGFSSVTIGKSFPISPIRIETSSVAKIKSGKSSTESTSANTSSTTIVYGIPLQTFVSAPPSTSGVGSDGQGGIYSVLLRVRDTLASILRSLQSMRLVR